jgi:hypothetical protein
LEDHHHLPKSKEEVAAAVSGLPKKRTGLAINPIKRVMLNRRNI